jgi:hypothetical protein
MTSKITDIVYGAPAIGMKKNEFLLSSFNIPVFDSDKLLF